MRALLGRGLIAAVLLVAAAVPALPAQQPARRWERPGFDFRPNGAWRLRARDVRQARDAALARRDLDALNAPLVRGAPATARSAFAIQGVLRMPVLLIRFLNSPDTLTLPARQQFEDALLAPSPPSGRPFTLRTFYEQMSNNGFSVQGQVAGWVTVDSNDTWYEGSCNGDITCGGGGHTGPFLREALLRADPGLDFGQFDNDGPDGIANSPDDDGVVDVAAFIHAEIGGECGGSNLWSHRFFVGGWGGGAFVTNDPRKDASGTAIPGQFVQVSDYILQGGEGGGQFGCAAGQLMQIGILSHELGHGLGLPDFYDTNDGDGDDSEGIGNWGLMSSGNFTTAYSPSHMEGFSRFELGWVTMIDLTTNGTYALRPYASADTIFRITPPGANPRNEYFLIENRQGVLSDSALINGKGPGLLVWHVDRTQYNSGRLSNSVNTGPIHGLWLMQADGQNQLRSSAPNVRNRGDAGDPYPGTSGNTAFGFGTTPPATMNHDGSFVGFDLDSIRQLVPGGAMSFRLRFPAPLSAVDTPLAGGVMGASYVDTVRVTGGVGAYSFAVVSGSGTLPTGLALGASTGIISGIPGRDSTWSFAVSATAGAQSTSVPLRITIAAPQLTATAVVDQLLLGGTHLTADEARYLDLLGNTNGSLDVGDVVAWLDETGTPLPTALRAWLLGRARR